MNIPNILTTVRFFLIPVFVLVFYSTSQNTILYATSIFLLAGVTDVLDGYIARTYNMVTKWGVALDPLADKLMQLTVIICFTTRGYLPVWVIVVVGVKESLMVVGALFLYYRKDETVIPSNKYGKVATVAFYVVIIVVSFSRNTLVNYTVVLTAVVLTMIAFMNYFFGFKEANKGNNMKCIDK